MAFRICGLRGHRPRGRKEGSQDEVLICFLPAKDTTIEKARIKLKRLYAKISIEQRTSFPRLVKRLYMRSNQRPIRLGGRGREL